MDAGKKVWAPHIDEGFILGEICDFGTDTLTVQPLDGGKVRRFCFAFLPPRDRAEKKRNERAVSPCHCRASCNVEAMQQFDSAGAPGRPQWQAAAPNRP